MVYKPTNTGWWWLEPWNFMTFSWEFHILSQLTKSIIFQRGRYKNHQPDGRGGIITTTGEAIHSSRGLLFETWGTYQFSSRHGGLFPELSSTKLGATSLEKHQEVKNFKVFPWDGKSWSRPAAIISAFLLPMVVLFWFCVDCIDWISQNSWRISKLSWSPDPLWNLLVTSVCMSTYVYIYIHTYCIIYTDHVYLYIYIVSTYPYTYIHIFIINIYI